MATIDIRRNHSLDNQTVRQKAEELAQEMETKLHLKWGWEGERIRFHAESGTAKGTSGFVTVSPKDVRVEIDLPFLLRALKGSISSKVNAKLDKLLG
ncbi:MAG: polyhydroxyalkanoic acid system family protein [Polyangiaceae bacterium]|nr:polyhydroxyalkanoic acid system family protein [Polyangiaceae bacterium]